MANETNLNESRSGIVAEPWLDVESSVPIRVQRRLAELAEEHPKGIKVTELAMLYKKKYHMELHALSYEATSVLQLVGFLKNIFRQVDIKGKNIFLFPAFLPEGEHELNMRQKVDTTPTIVKNNMQKLLTDAKIQNPAVGGIYYEDFLISYEETYKCPLEFHKYNSDNFDEFIRKQKETWLKDKKINGKTILVYDIEEGVSGEKLYDLYLLQAMDRKKFPPDAISPHEKLEQLDLIKEFKVGEKLDVFIPEAVSCDRFFMQLKRYVDDLDKIETSMDDFYKIEADSVKMPQWVLASGVFCATYYRGKENWYRVQIDRVAINNGTCRCYYVDNGKFWNLNPNNLFYLQKKFATLPMQAVCSSLAFADPYFQRWSDASNSRFRSLTQGNSIVAQVVSVNPEAGQVTVELFANGVNVLDVLVAERLAKKRDDDDEENIKDTFEIAPDLLTPPPEDTNANLNADALEFVYDPLVNYGKWSAASLSKPHAELSSHNTSTPKLSPNDIKTETVSQLNSPVPSFTPSSMPLLSSEMKINMSLSNTSPNSLTNIKQEQMDNTSLHGNEKSNSSCPVERPARCTSTPAVVQHTNISSPHLSLPFNSIPSLMSLVSYPSDNAVTTKLNISPPRLSSPLHSAPSSSSSMSLVSNNSESAATSNSLSNASTWNQNLICAAPKDCSTQLDKLNGRPNLFMGDNYAVVPRPAAPKFNPNVRPPPGYVINPYAPHPQLPYYPMHPYPPQWWPSPPQMNVFPPYGYNQYYRMPVMYPQPYVNQPYMYPVACKPPQMPNYVPPTSYNMINGLPNQMLVTPLATDAQTPKLQEKEVTPPSHSFTGSEGVGIHQHKNMHSEALKKPPTPAPCSVINEHTNLMSVDGISHLTTNTQAPKLQVKKETLPSPSFTGAEGIGMNQHQHMHSEALKKPPTPAPCSVINEHTNLMSVDGISHLTTNTQAPKLQVKKETLPSPSFTGSKGVGWNQYQHMHSEVCEQPPTPAPCSVINEHTNLMSVDGISHLTTNTQAPKLQVKKETFPSPSFTGAEGVGMNQHQHMHSEVCEQPPTPVPCNMMDRPASQVKNKFLSNANFLTPLSTCASAEEKKNEVTYAIIPSAKEVAATTVVKDSLRDIDAAVTEGPLQRRPRVETKHRATDLLVSEYLTEVTVCDKKLTKITLRSVGYFMVKQVLENFTHADDSENLFKKNSIFGQLHPPLNEYPLLYQELIRKHVINEISPIHLIPIREFARLVNVAGAKSEDVLLEASKIVMEHCAVNEFVDGCDIDNDYREIAF